MEKLTNLDNHIENSDPTKLLAETLEQITHWRANKKSPEEPIPTHLWEEIFQLEHYFSPFSLRNIFNVSNKQYKAKLEERQLKKPEATTQKFIECNSSTNHDTSVVSFEAVKPVVKELYQPDLLPSAKTLIVELCRADGQIMKIHTTQDSISSLMSSNRITLLQPRPLRTELVTFATHCSSLNKTVVFNNPATAVNH